MSHLDHTLESQQLTLESAQLENRLKVQHIAEQDAEIENLKRDIRQLKDEQSKTTE